MRYVPVAVLLALALLVEPPSTKKQPVTDVYHGVRVTDDYRWLEDGSSKEVQAWSDAQNTHARAILDKLPGADRIRSRVKEILIARTVRHDHLVFRGGQLFALKRQP